MSQSFEHTSASFCRLWNALHQADEDTRYKFVFWLTGIGIMGTSIGTAFGWPGVAFCIGAVVYCAGNAPSRPPLYLDDAP